VCRSAVVSLIMSDATYPLNNKMVVGILAIF
jgi:hypothetical protein